MKKVIALAALAVLALTPVAHANEAVKAETTATTTETTKTETTVEAKEATLKDGTKISIEGDKVFVVSADGERTPAPDAEHELADGTKVKTHAGVIVK